MYEACEDHVIVRLPAAAEMTKGGVHLASETGKDFRYGRVISKGCEVEDPRIQLGDIVIFDLNGVKSVTLSRTSKTLFYALAKGMTFCRVSEQDLKLEGLPIPEPLTQEEIDNGTKEVAEEGGSQAAQEDGTRRMEGSLATRDPCTETEKKRARAVGTGG